MIEIREFPIEQLTPAPYNPRRPLTAAAHRKLKASLREFGLVVGGHARLSILRELGHTVLPVSVVRLSPEREKALNVVLNNQEAQGRYDSAKLLSLLDELTELPELSLTGFDAADLRNLKFSPVAELPREEERNRVEITLVVDPEKYSEFAPALDELVRRFDLVSHVRTVGE
jgi:ParB-like chromosome segregation protein Spo0J